jgi:hypothetical protein
VHRVKTSWNKPVYLNSAGCMQYSKETGKEDHFVCVSRKMPKTEGDREIERFEKRFQPMIGSQTPTELLKELHVSIRPRTGHESESDTDETTNPFEMFSITYDQTSSLHSPSDSVASQHFPEKRHFARLNQTEIGMNELESNQSMSDLERDINASQSSQLALDHNHNDISEMKNIGGKENFGPILQTGSCNDVIEKNFTLEMVNNQRVFCGSIQNSARQSSRSPVQNCYFKLDTIRNPEIPPYITSVPSLPLANLPAQPRPHPMSPVPAVDHTPLIQALYRNSVTKEFTHVNPRFNPTHRTNNNVTNPSSSSSSPAFSFKSLSNFDGGKMVSQALFVNLENEPSPCTPQNSKNVAHCSQSSNESVMIENQASNSSTSFHKRQPEVFGSTFKHLPDACQSRAIVPSQSTGSVDSTITPTVYSFSNQRTDDNLSTPVESNCQPQRRVLVQRNHVHLTPEEAYAVNPNALYDQMSFMQTLTEELNQRQLAAFASQRSFTQPSPSPSSQPHQHQQPQLSPNAQHTFESSALQPTSALSASLSPYSQTHDSNASHELTNAFLPSTYSHSDNMDVSGKFHFCFLT